jgi:hypothetical protein
MPGEGSPPWIASLHDLKVISKVIERPAEFLLYLRRRADSGVTDYHRAADEPDLFMLSWTGPPRRAGRPSWHLGTAGQ